ncbi:membrane protein insertion efficiency factor YidD [Huintestinicola sp.]
MTPLDRLSQLFKTIVILPIKFYKRFISPSLPARCRYYPSCSTYAVEAIRKHGAVKGMILGGWRILRCNPWARGGVDHVPEKFSLTYCFKKENKQ